MTTCSYMAAYSGVDSSNPAAAGYAAFYLIGAMIILSLAGGAEVDKKRLGIVELIWFVFCFLLMIYAGVTGQFSSE